MPKIKLQLDNYNKFIDFLGKDWVEKKYSEYINNPKDNHHPFIEVHSAINSSYLYKKEIIPKEIYLNMLLKNYQKYNFIGSFLYLITEETFPRIKSLKKRLKNPDEYDDTIFELLTFAILLNSNLKPQKNAEKEKQGNPDFLIKDKNNNIFSIESTRKNTPGVIKDQNTKLGDRLSKYIEDNEHICRFYLSTFLDIEKEEENLFRLAIEVIDKKANDNYSYCEDKIKILFEVSEFKKNETHTYEEYLDRYPLLLNLPANAYYNLLSSFKGIKSSNLEDVLNSFTNPCNISEIALNQEIDICRSIMSTVSNKFDTEKEGKPRNKQIIEGIPHYIFLQIPEHLNSLYEIDLKELREKLKEILKTSHKIQGIVIVEEKFGQDPHGKWGYAINSQIIENPTLSETQKIEINKFEEEIQNIK